MFMLKKLMRHLMLKPQALRVTRIENDYDQTFTYWMKPKGRIEFTAGQFAHLIAPKEGIDKSTVRHMSIASAPQDEELLFSMSVASKSVYKKRFADVKVGDKVQLFRISGEFTLDGIPEGSELVFIAGGIGITPIRSLIREIELRKLNYPWAFIHVARNYLYKEDLAQYSNPQTHIGRKDVPDTIAKTVAEKPEAWYFVSGSENFIENLADRIAEHGVDRTRIRTENFNH